MGRYGTDSRYGTQQPHSRIVVTAPDTASDLDAGVIDSLDPQSDILEWQATGTARGRFLYAGGQETTATASPGLSGATTGRIYFDSTANAYRVSQAGGAYAGLLVSLGAQTITVDDAVNNTFTDVLTLVHTTTDAGFGVAPIGAGLLFRSEDAAGNTEDAARIVGYLSTTTNGSEGGALGYYTRSAGGALALRWVTQAAGHLVAQTDNSVDIGASGTSRPRTVYVGTSVITPSATVSGLTATGMMYAGTGGLLTSTSAPTDGQLLIGDTGGVPLLGTLTATANQTTVTNAAGSITIGTAQDIAAASSPTFVTILHMGLAQTINTDATAAVDEDPSLILLGGDGVGAPNDDLVRSTLWQDSSAERTFFYTERNRNGGGYAVVDTIFGIGHPTSIAGTTQTLRFHGGTGAAMNDGRLVWNPTGTSFAFTGESRVDMSNLRLGTGGAVQTGTSAGNTALLQAYDVDGAAYATFATLTASDTPTMDLAAAVTIGGAYVYRVGGTDVAVADGGTGVGTFTSDGVLYGNGTGAVQATAQGGANTVLVANAGAPSFSTSPTLTSLTTTGDVVIQGNLTVQGATSTTQGETTLFSDNHLYLNAGYTTAAAQTAGLVANYFPTATTDTVAAGGFTAGVAAVSNPTVATVGAATFSVGQFVQVSGATAPGNNGLFEVLTHAANVLTIRGIGTTATVEDFTQNQFTTSLGATGTLTLVRISTLRCGGDGLWEAGGPTTEAPLSFGNLYFVGAADVALADGGTSASLVASNGGIFYSTATAGAILAGTATAKQILMSGSSAAPAWSTAVYPDSTTANQLLYSSGANTVTGLSSANSGVLVTSGAGVPSIATDIPTGVTIGSAYIYRVGGTNVAVADGGTNLDSYAVGDLLYASAATTLAKLADVAVGQVLVSGGVGVAPTWSASPTVSSLTASTDDAVANGIANVLTLRHMTMDPGFGQAGIGVSMRMEAENDAGSAVLAAGLEASLSTEFAGLETGSLLIGAASAGVPAWGIQLAPSLVTINPAAVAMNFAVLGSAIPDMLRVDGGNDTMALGAFPLADTRLNVAFPTITQTTGLSGQWAQFTPALTEAASGTHPYLAGINIAAPTFTDGAGATGIAATLRIAGAPTGITPTDAALAFQVAAGTTRLGGDLDHDGTNIGFFGGALTPQQVSGADLTNNVTAGGVNDTITDWTDLGTYATDAAAIRNAVYQLARKLKQINDGLRDYGLFT